MCARFACVAFLESLSVRLIIDTARVLMLFGEENRVVALMFVPAFTTCAKTICKKTKQKNNNDNNKKMSMHAQLSVFAIFWARDSLYPTRDNFSTI